MSAEIERRGNWPDDPIASRLASEMVGQDFLNAPIRSRRREASKRDRVPWPGIAREHPHDIRIFMELHPGQLTFQS